LIDNTVGVYGICERCHIPSKSTVGSACFDLRACLHTKEIKVNNHFTRIVKNFNEDDAYVEIYPDETLLIPTGLIFCIPETHHIKIYSRSGNTWKKGLVVHNAPAIIDSDYTNETFVLLRNESIYCWKIYDGDRIAQCEIVKNSKEVFVEISKEDFESHKKLVIVNSSRRGGFGSTGVS